MSRKRVDSTLTSLSVYELHKLREQIVAAICDQPAHDNPAFNAEVAYELSVINWDILRDLAYQTHLFDEWFDGIAA